MHHGQPAPSDLEPSCIVGTAWGKKTRWLSPAVADRAWCMPLQTESGAYCTTGIEVTELGRQPGRGARCGQRNSCCLAKSLAATDCASRAARWEYSLWFGAFACGCVHHEAVPPLPGMHKWLRLEYTMAVMSQTPWLTRISLCSGPFAHGNLSLCAYAACFRNASGASGGWTQCHHGVGADELNAKFFHAVCWRACEYCSRMPNFHVVWRRPVPGLKVEHQFIFLWTKWFMSWGAAHSVLTVRLSSTHPITPRRFIWTTPKTPVSPKMSPGRPLASTDADTPAPCISVSANSLTM